MTIFLDVFPLFEPKDSIFFTTSMPSLTWPNTTCLPSSLWGGLSQVRKRPAPRPLGRVVCQRNTPYPDYSLITVCELSNCTPLGSRLPGQVLLPWALSWQPDLIFDDVTYEKWVVLILPRKMMGIAALKKARHLHNRLQQTEHQTSVRSLEVLSSSRCVSSKKRTGT